MTLADVVSIGPGILCLIEDGAMQKVEQGETTAEPKES